ncbi:hypothetical protein YC2023_088723 [Brassica napus]
MAGQTDPHISLFSPHEKTKWWRLFLNMNMDPLNFIAGDYGRFVPQIQTQMPLWLAVALKRRGKCTHDKPEADADADTRSSSRQPREASNEPRTSKATLRNFEIFCNNICGAPLELRTSTASIPVVLLFALFLLFGYILFDIY